MCNSYPVWAAILVLNIKLCVSVDDLWLGLVYAHYCFDWKLEMFVFGDLVKVEGSSDDKRKEYEKEGRN